MKTLISNQNIYGFFYVHISMLKENRMRFQEALFCNYIFSCPFYWLEYNQFDYNSYNFMQLLLKVLVTELLVG